MDEFNREEWGPILLGFFGVFIGLGIMVFGMLPAWVFLGALLVVFGLPALLFLAARQLFFHH